MAATEQGIYLYGIIQTSQDRAFPIEGLQNEPISTIGFNGLAAVYSPYEFNGRQHVKSSRVNMLAHQKVLEYVMQEYTILPFSFGTVTESMQEIDNLLRNRYRIFEKNLNWIEGRIELGVKAFWKNPDKVFNDIATNNGEVKKLKAYIEKTGDQAALIEVGKKVSELLELKKQNYAEVIAEELAPTAVEYKINKSITDAMFLNASFLVNKSREIEFDNVMEELGEKYEGEIDFKYVGPLPVYSFIDLTIELEEWEK